MGPHFGVGANAVAGAVPSGQRTRPLRGQLISYMCAAAWLITRACGQLEAQCEVEMWGCRFLRVIARVRVRHAHAAFFLPTPPKAVFPASKGATAGLLPKLASC